MRLQALLQCTKWLDILYCLHCTASPSPSSFIALHYGSGWICVLLCDEIFPGQSTKADLTSSPSTLPVLYCSSALQVSPLFATPIRSILLWCERRENPYTHSLIYWNTLAQHTHTHILHTPHTHIQIYIEKSTALTGIHCSTTNLMPERRQGIGKAQFKNNTHSHWVSIGAADDAVPHMQDSEHRTQMNRTEQNWIAAMLRHIIILEESGASLMIETK